MYTSLYSNSNESLQMEGPELQLDKGVITIYITYKMVKQLIKKMELRKTQNDEDNKNSMISNRKLHPLNYNLMS